MPNRRVKLATGALFGVPTNYRPSSDERRCSSCAHHRVTPGKAWAGKGTCGKFSCAVSEDWVCDLFEMYGGNPDS